MWQTVCLIHLLFISFLHTKCHFNSSNTVEVVHSRTFDTDQPAWLANLPYDDFYILPSNLVCRSMKLTKGHNTTMNTVNERVLNHSQYLFKQFTFQPCQCFQMLQRQHQGSFCRQLLFLSHTPHAVLSPHQCSTQ